MTPRARRRCSRHRPLVTLLIAADCRRSKRGFGKDNAYASCLLGEGALAVIADHGKELADYIVVIQRAVGSDWVEVGRYECWADAYRALGALLDEGLDRVPIDPIDRPSPTVLIAGDNGCVEVMYRTAEGIRIARAR
jgi:hypothetical protein